MAPPSYIARVIKGSSRFCKRNISWRVTFWAFRLKQLVVVQKPVRSSCKRAFSAPFLQPFRTHARAPRWSRRTARLSAPAKKKRRSSTSRLRFSRYTHAVTGSAREVWLLLCNFSGFNPGRDVAFPSRPPTQHQGAAFRPNVEYILHTADKYSYAHR